MLRRALLALPLLGAALAPPATAQQVLYEPPPPPGAAQVRFFNALPGTTTVRPDFAAALTLGTEPAQRISRYTVVPAVAGKSFSLTISSGGRQQVLPLALEPNKQVTVLLLAQGPLLRARAVVDEVEFNQTRARLRFYNATPDCNDAALVVANGGPRVFGEVPAGEARMRAVNPVVAEVQAGCAAGQAPVFPLRNLEVGAGYSIWLMAPAGALAAFVTADGNRPWAP
jgi:hypothetical protein